MSTPSERYINLRERVKTLLHNQKKLLDRSRSLRQENRILKERLKQEKQLRVSIQYAFDNAQERIITDEATGLRNRAGLLGHYEWLTTTTLRFLRYNPSSFYVKMDDAECTPITLNLRSVAPMVLVIIDLNNFKRINDTFGHIVGDTVLTAFAEIMRTTFRRRRYDLPARVGGDEFAVLLPMTSLEKAEHLMRRFQILFETSTSQAIKLFLEQGGGFSYGMSQVLYYASGDPFTDAWKKADEHMYQMKGVTKQFARAG